MPDQRSVMKEFRSLEQKRSTEGLTPAEEARLAQLRDLIGPEAGAGGLRGGFDVNAAAARLRESLLPAGLRNRPPPEPEPEPEAAPEPELSPADALAGAWAEEPFAPLEPAAASDALFEPSSLGLDEPAADDGVLAAEWDPNAGGDPSAGYGAAAQDAPAATSDPSAEGYGGEVGADPAAAGWDPAAQAPGNADQGYDPATWPGAGATAEPYAGAQDASDPGAPAGWDPNAPFDPDAPPAWDASQPFDPSAPYPAPYDPNAQDAADPNAPAGWDPNAPFDPDAPPAWDASQPFDPSAPYPAPYDPNAQAYDPNVAPAWDPGAPPANDAGAAQLDASLDGFADDGSRPPTLEGDGAGWDPSVAAPRSPAPADGGPFDEDALAGPDAASGAAPLVADAGALLPDGWELAAPGPEAAPADAPLGEYDEIASTLPAGEDAGIESMLPLVPGAETPVGAEPGERSGAPTLGEYDDTAGFSSAAFLDAAPADLSPEGGGFEAARTVEPLASEGWHPETAVESGFLLESGGSFDAAAEAVAPDWAVGGEPPPWGEADAAPAGVPADAAAPDEAEPAQSNAPPEPELPSFDVDVAEADAFATAEPDAAGFDSPAGEVGPADGHLGLDPEANAPEPSGPAPALDFSMPDLSAGQPEDDFTTPQAPALAAPPAEEEIPTIDGEEILEEIPAEDGAAAPALPLDFEPLVVPPPAAVSPPLAPPLAAAAPAALPAPPAPVAPPAAVASLAPAATAPHATAPLAPPPALPPECVIQGVHRVVVHTVEGQVKRGVLEGADLAADTLALAAQPGGPPELVGTDKVKAIFFMLAPGDRPPAPEGKKVRVTFRDGRQIAGFSPDYDETGPGFFMVPGDTRTNTGRIWVYRASVKQVAVS